MTERAWLAQRFEANREHLRGVAYRMLGSLSEADDAVQETWLRLSRTDVSAVENLSGWLTTVVARVCLDQLRVRKARREESLGTVAAASVRGDTDGGDPEQEALLAEAVGLAMLVVLETLTPAERIAFVLHDLFAVPFADIAPIVQRSPAATRQLASRARRRVRGTDPTHAVARSQQRRLVDAFLAAARAGDFAALLAILDPDVVLRTYPAGRLDAPHDIRGAEAVATRTARGGAREAQPALIDGAVGVIVAPRGRMMMVLAFTIAHGKIARIEAIADPKRLGQLHLAVLGE